MEPKSSLPCSQEPANFETLFNKLALAVRGCYPLSQTPKHVIKSICGSRTRRFNTTNIKASHKTRS
jgi:hypothetical protein